MSKHTPGPWDAGVSLWKGNEVFTSVSRKDTSVITAICGFTGAEDEEESIANANLIAAAPELLEACETFHEWLVREEIGFANKWDRNTEEGEAKWREWYDENLRLCALAQGQARAAIAKAKGETK